MILLPGDAKNWTWSLSLSKACALLPGPPVLSDCRPSWVWCCITSTESGWQSEWYLLLWHLNQKHLNHMKQLLACTYYCGSQQQSFCNLLSALLQLHLFFWTEPVSSSRTRQTHLHKSNLCPLKSNGTFEPLDMMHKSTLYCYPLMNVLPQQLLNFLNSWIPFYSQHMTWGFQCLSVGGISHHWCTKKFQKPPTPILWSS